MIQQFMTSSRMWVLSVFQFQLSWAGTPLGCKMPSRSKMAVHTSLFVSKRRDEDTSPSDLKYSFFPSVLLGPNAMSQLAYTNRLGQTIGYSFIRCKDAFGYFLFILLTIRDTISYCLYLISLLTYCTSVSLEVVEFVTSS